MRQDNNHFLDPESVLPDQYFSTAKLPPAIQSEVRLMLAVLEDAIDCYQRYARSKIAQQREEFENAQQWIESDETEWVFSFESICTVLGIDPNYIRDGLRRAAPKQMLRIPTVQPCTPQIRPLADRRARAEAIRSAALRIAS